MSIPFSSSGKSKKHIETCLGFSEKKKGMKEERKKEGKGEMFKIYFCKIEMLSISKHFSFVPPYFLKSRQVCIIIIIIAICFFLIYHAQIFNEVIGNVLYKCYRRITHQ